MAENSSYSWIEAGSGVIGLIGCGVDYAYIKDAENKLNIKYPVLRLSTLPLPRQKVIEFLRGLKTVIVFEELEPVVEQLIKEICYEEGINIQVLGRKSFLPSTGELLNTDVIEALARLEDQAIRTEAAASDANRLAVPIRTRTQCVGCG
jgi:indolepyruvate ferredoxin oxidoreductase alpha subunit